MPVPQHLLTPVIEERKQLRARIDATITRAASEGRAVTDDERADMDRAAADLEAVENRIAQLIDDAMRADAVEERLRPYSGQPSGGPTVWRRVGTSAIRAEALRYIDEMGERVAGRDATELLVSTLERDAGDRIANIVAPLADPAYLRAFMKTYVDPARGHMLWTGEEHQAWVRVMATNPATAGGAAVPAYLDPVWTITGDGAISPVRRLARVVKTPVSPWRGITAEQVTAGWKGENTAMTASTPAMDNATVDLHLGNVWVPYSYELEDDVVDLAAQLSMVMRDGAATLEADAFVVGGGSGEPEGFVSTLAATTASRVAPTTGGAFGLVDVYKLADAVAPRHSTRYTWAAAPPVVNKIRRFAETVTGHTAAFLSDLGAGSPPNLLGRPLAEFSEMSSSITTGESVLVALDYSRLVVADHVGGTRLERVQNVVDGSGVPTGTRGAILWWRTGSKLIDPNAGRVLKL